MQISNVAGLIDPERIFATAATQSRFKSGLDIDKAKVYLLDIATAAAANALAASTLEHVNALYEEHEMVYGPLPDDKDLTREDWETALDEAANTKFAPFAVHTGQGWQGEYLDDCQLWDEALRQKLAHSFGLAFVEGALGETDDVTGKSRVRKPGKRLAAFGITQEDVEAFMAGLPKPASPEQKAKTLAEATEIVHQIVQTYAAEKGVELDLAEFMLVIDQAADSDDILASSSLAMLDAGAEPQGAVAAFRALKENSGTYTDDLVNMLFSEEVPATPEPTPAQEAKADKKKRAPREKATTVADTATIPSALLQQLSEIGGTDREMAELFNVQRPAYNKAKNGEMDLYCHKDRVAEVKAWIERRGQIAADAHRAMGAL